MLAQSRFLRKKSSECQRLLPQEWCNNRALERQQLAENIVAHSLQFNAVTDARLRKLLDAAVISLEPENTSNAFAILCEIIFRTLGMRPYWTQVVAAMLALDHQIAEMDTGEGKSLSTLIAACWASLQGWPVHIITANDYLAERDEQDAAPLANWLSISSRSLLSGQADHERHVAFSAQWIFTTGKELVFEFLRDELALQDNKDAIRHAVKALHEHQQTRRPYFNGLGIALIDEADSVLIDEASTPCVISGEGGKAWSTEECTEALNLAKQLNADEHYIVNEQLRFIIITEQGNYDIEKLHTSALLKNTLYRKALILLALKSIYLFRSGIEYIIRDEKIIIVDQLTGRLMPDRRWQQGIHEMVEIKEACPLTVSRKALGKLSYQQFFKYYPMLGGMTGTALEVAPELTRVYGVKVARVPRLHPLKRIDKGVKWFESQECKLNYLTATIVKHIDSGMAVLVAASSVSDSQKISNLLKEEGIDHQMLNGLQDASEADLIAQAGQNRRVTVATSVAGRGTDIKLAEEVKNSGGLHVIMLEFLAFSRMDRQLIGRSARQSDPGSYEVLCGPFDDLLASNWYPKTLVRRPTHLYKFWIKRLQNRNERRAADAREKLEQWEQDRKSWLSFLKST